MRVTDLNTVKYHYNKLQDLSQMYSKYKKPPELK
jgi:hypothetical protein